MVFFTSEFFSLWSENLLAVIIHDVNLKIFLKGFASAKIRAAINLRNFLLRSEHFSLPTCVIIDHFDAICHGSLSNITKNAARCNNRDDLANLFEIFILFKSVFRTQSNIYDESFCESSWKSLTIDPEMHHHRCSTEF